MWLYVKSVVIKVKSQNVSAFAWRSFLQKELLIFPKKKKEAPSMRNLWLICQRLEMPGMIKVYFLSDTYLKSFTYNNDYII